MVGCSLGPKWRCSSVLGHQQFPQSAACNLQAPWAACRAFVCSVSSRSMGREKISCRTLICQGNTTPEHCLSAMQKGTRLQLFNK